MRTEARGVSLDRPHVAEAEALTRLCLRAKAAWGYDAAFMATVRPALTVAADDIAAGLVRVAREGRAVAGVVALAPGETPDAMDLDKLFVDPSRHGCGIGRVLFGWAVREAVRRGADRLTILSDSNAAGFYARLGAGLVGPAPSDSVPGRTLPLYLLRLPGRTRA